MLEVMPYAIGLFQMLMADVMAVVAGLEDGKLDQLEASQPQH